MSIVWLCWLLSAIQSIPLTILMEINRITELKISGIVLKGKIYILVEIGKITQANTLEFINQADN